MKFLHNLRWKLALRICPEAQREIKGLCDQLEITQADATVRVRQAFRRGVREGHLRASSDEQIEPIARLLHWNAPAHIPAPHGGVCARTFAEFPKNAGEGVGYWKEGEPLYTARFAAALTADRESLSPHTSGLRTSDAAAPICEAVCAEPSKSTTSPSTDSGTNPDYRCAHCGKQEPGWDEYSRKRGWRWNGAVKEYHCREAAIDD